MTDLGTRLITGATEQEILTVRRECDCHTALTRGLAEYLAQIKMPENHQLSQSTRLLRIETDWADIEAKNSYPAAAVYTQAPGTFDDSNLTTHQVHLEDGNVIRVLSELTQVIVVDVFATSKPQRSAFGMMLEDSFDPVDWMSGFRLALPHYHGVHADFLKVEVDYVDDNENAQKKWRLVQYHLEARIPQIKIVGRLPKLDVRVQTEINL